MSIKSPHKIRSGLFTATLIVIILTPACIVQRSGPAPEGIEATLESLQGALSYQATELAAQATMISYLATRGPASVPPNPPPTVFTDEQFSGSVVLEDGFCCVGATVGETVELQARFEASSPYAEVTEMRFQASAGPLSADKLDTLSTWEPYRQTHIFSTTAAVNWVGFYVSVQFRDAAGNLSSVFWDDISIEGNPPSPTP